MRLEVSAAQWRVAGRIAQEYSDRKIETVLAAFVADMAVAAERPGSWEHERVTAWLASHVWECEPAVPAELLGRTIPFSDEKEARPCQ